MVAYGIPPMMVIRSATSVAAELLQMQDQLGSLEAGKLADIIAVDGDPLEDIEVPQKVRIVMKEGKVYKNETAK